MAKASVMQLNVSMHGMVLIGGWQRDNYIATCLCGWVSSQNRFGNPIETSVEYWEDHMKKKITNG